MCVAGIGFGTVAVVADVVTSVPVPVLPVAALSVAVCSGVLAVWLTRTRWLRLAATLICCAFLVLGFGYLVNGGPNPATRLFAVVVLLLAALCAVPAWPEVKRVLTRTKMRSVIRAQEYHAARIAGELHDEVLQALALVSRRLDTAVKQDEPAAVDSAARDAVELLTEQAAVLRSIVGALHPVILRQVGLAEATRALARQVAAANGLIITVDMPGSSCHEQVGDSEVATAAYRVIQEALTNVVKHADATTVDIELLCQRKYLSVTVVDDGRGLPEAGCDPSTRYGLEGMRWRCEAHGGVFSISGRPGRGTRLSAVFPLEDCG